MRPCVPVLLLITIAVLPLAAEGGDEASRVPPLPAIELPPKPAPPEGAPQAEEANRRIHDGDYAGSLPLWREAWAKGVRAPLAAYNAACAAAVTGEIDEAFVWLDRAAAAGFRDLDHAAVDGDLDALREDVRFARWVERAKGMPSEDNAELEALKQADQAARRGPISPDAWEAIAAADAERRARVAEMVAAGEVRTGADHFNAALIYQHGDRLEDYAKAREHAARAVELGDERGRWLAAAAWDRWLLHAGYPQRFGTQYTCPRDGECELRPWDENTTDEERARWNVPSLEEALRRAETMR